MNTRVKLSKGLYAQISPEDFDRVNAFKWYASLESRGTKHYAIRWVLQDGKRIKIRMHRFILDLPPGALDPDHVVHHVNDDGLDNRRENLARITQAENMKLANGWKKRKVTEPCL